jgi:hypothetical protein
VSTIDKRVERLEQARPTDAQDARRWRETLDRIGEVYGCGPACGGELDPAVAPSEAEVLDVIAGVYAEG